MRYNEAMPEASSKSDVQLSAPGPRPARQVERWTAHQPNDARRRGWLGIGSGILLLILVSGVSGKWYLGVLVLVAAAVVFWKHYLPVTYEVDVQGLQESVGKFGRFIAWNQVHRAEVVEDGLLFLPRAGNELFARWRSIHVPCRDRLAAVQRLIELQAPWAASWAREDSQVG